MDNGSASLRLLMHREKKQMELDKKWASYLMRNCDQTQKPSLPLQNHQTALRTAGLSRARIDCVNVKWLVWKECTVVGLYGAEPLWGRISDDAYGFNLEFPRALQGSSAVCMVSFRSVFWNPRSSIKILTPALFCYIIFSFTFVSV